MMVSSTLQRNSNNYSVNKPIHVLAKTLGSVFMLLLVCGAYGQQIRKGKTTLDFRLYGKVKNLEITTVNRNKSETKLSPRIETYTFNEEGRSTFYSFQGANWYSEVFYDTVGYAVRKVINGKEYRFINSYMLGALMKVEYDSIISKDDFLPFWMFGYDGDFNLGFETHYNSERFMVFNYKHVYDKYGRKIGITRKCCDENAEFHTKLIGEKFEYNRRSNVIKHSIFSEEFGKAEIHHKEYNSRNRVTKDSIVISFNSSYSIKPKKRSRENLSRVKTYTYDEEMNLIIETCKTEFDKKPLVYTYEYEFDASKNWTRRVKKLDDEIIQETTRVITYY